MTRLELNRDIKRLANAIKKEVATYKPNEENKEYYTFIEKAKKEYERLYHADNNFTYINANSMRIMIRLNVRYRFIPLHLFGINIEL